MQRRVDVRGNLRKSKFRFRSIRIGAERKIYRHAWEERCRLKTEYSSDGDMENRLKAK